MSKARGFRGQLVEVLIRNLPVDENKQQLSLLKLMPEYFSVLDQREQSLAKNIAFGVNRNYFFLQALVDRYLNKPLRKKDLDIRCVLFASAYELLFLNTPDHAVISEWVELCKRRKKVWAKGLVNAFLRELQRSGTDVDQIRTLLIKEASNDKPGNKKELELKHEHPFWLIDCLKRDWPEHYLDILSQNNRLPPMVLRVNDTVCSVEKYLSMLEEKNIKARKGSLSKNSVYLNEAIDVTDLPNFNDGWVSVQDEAAQLAAGILELEAGQRVLDACSAPGGKALHMLQQSPDIDLLCLDKSHNRLEKVRENLQRANLHANCVAADACDIANWWHGKTFDRILLDAPCSASGIIRRNPDIKLQRREADLARLSAMQSDLMEKLWACLKPGGLLLYSTCSVFKQENQLVIEAFLGKFEDAQLKKTSPEPGFDTGFGYQLFPQPNGHDGFFYALLEKTIGA